MADYFSQGAGANYGPLGGSGGAARGTGNLGNSGYQWGGPTNVGEIAYQQGQAANQANPWGGDAGIRPYNTAISNSAAAAWSPPSFSNTISPNSWNAIAANTRTNPNASNSNMVAGGTNDLYSQIMSGGRGGTYTLPSWGDSSSITNSLYGGADYGNVGFASGTPSYGLANQTLAGTTAAQSTKLGSGATNWGIVNNNPGNINAGSWASLQPGYVNPGAGNRFAQFSDMYGGVNALENNLGAYGSRGINTPAAIASTWAPPSENNTGRYASNLASYMGVSPSSTVNLSDPWTRLSAASGIISNETGTPNSNIQWNIANSPQTALNANVAGQVFNSRGVANTVYGNLGR